VVMHAATVVARRTLRQIQSLRGVLWPSPTAIEQVTTPASHASATQANHPGRSTHPVARGQQKGTQVTKTLHALAVLLTRTSAAGRPASRAFTGTRAPSPGRGHLLPLAAAAFTITAALAFTATPALASTAHTYAGQFGSVGTGAGAFGAGGPNTITFNQATGDVFAADPVRFAGEGIWAPRVERFNAAGDYQSSFNLDAATLIIPEAFAVDPAGSVSIYVSGMDAVTQVSGVVQKYSASGTLESTLNLEGSATTLPFPVFLAVDPADGTLYVSASAEGTGTPVIDKFDDTGKFISSFDGSTGSPDGAFGGIGALAVDASHRVYVTDPSKARVDRYSAAGVWEATVDDGSRGAPGAISVDPTSSLVYVLEAGPLGQQVSSFSAGGGALLESFGAGHLTNATSLAVNHAAGTVYTADAGIGAVERFTIFIAPTVATEGSSAITATEATLAGTINPEGVAGITTYRFDYGLDTHYGASSAETDTGGGPSDVPAAATITGLQPATTYHYRLFGTNTSGTSAGADNTFTTQAAQPAIDLQPPFASNMNPSGATLNATINPNGADTKYRFEYGTEVSYGSSTPDGDAGSAVAETRVSLPVTGLAPSTTYHFRIVVENGIGAPVQGADAMFTTAPATPATATDISAVSARLQATINPQGSNGSYLFEYGTTTAYGSTTPAVGVSSGVADVPVSQNTGVLTPGTTYHFRVVETVNNIGQTVSSNDATFTTVASPAVTTLAVTGVTPTSATLNAKVDTHGNAGTASFAITSPDSAYANTSASAALSSSSGPQSVSIPLSGLPSGTHYVVSASATVAGTTGWGEQVLFSTPGLPPFNPSPPPPPISGAPYGCAAPHINAVNVHPKAGDSVTVTGSDLGVGGAIALGNAQLQPSSWSASAIVFQVPEGVSGTQPLSVNCGVVSNVVGMAIFAPPPSNAFTIGKVSVKGSTATLSVSVPGPGKLQVAGAKSAAASITVGQASTAALSVHLSKGGKKALAKARRKKLAVSLRVTFTPAGGTAAAKTQSITFKRGGK
jgi:hypothetical protein